MDSSSNDSDSSSDEDELEFHERESLSGLSDGSVALDISGAPGSLMADAEFRTEVQQSLERAFAEGHSVENASVELKTLRMASNVPLRRVKEAVVAAIVEKINVVEGDPGLQRKEIGSVVGRWGELIDRIGGVDPVETVSILQVINYLHLIMPYDRRLFLGTLCGITAHASIRSDPGSALSGRHCGRGRHSCLACP